MEQRTSLFDNKHIKRYAQGVLVMVGDWKHCVSYDGLNFYSCRFDNEKPSAIIQENKLSDVCVITGLVESKSEFTRKLKEHSLKLFNWGREIKFDKDFVFPQIENEYEVILGSRILEIVTPTPKFNLWKFLINYKVYRGRAVQKADV